MPVPTPPAWKTGFKEVSCYASAARTATPTAMADQTNNGRYKGIRVTINTTAAGTSPSTVFTIQGKDPVTGAYYTVLASAAVTGVGVTTLYVYPGAAVSANASANFILPSTWRVIATHGNGTSHTYVAGAELLP